MVAGGFAEDVFGLEGGGGEGELGAEGAEEDHAEGVGVGGEGLEEGFVGCDFGGVRARWGDGVHVVFGNVKEFGCVWAVVGVGGFDGAGGFVAEERDAFDEGVGGFGGEVAVEGGVGDLEEGFGVGEQGLAEWGGAEVEVEEALGLACVQGGGTGGGVGGEDGGEGDA